MAEGIVELFEMVDIEHHDGDRLVVAGAAAYLAFESDLHEMPVEEAGEAIPDRLVLETAAQVQASDGNRGELNQLLQRPHVGVDHGSQTRRKAFDVDESQRVSISG